MLHYSAVDTATLDLLKRLLQIPLFKDLRLAGGTSLALQLGHRKSVDIDLFGLLEADDLSVSDALRIFNSVTIIQKSENIAIYSIEGIKVDIVNYGYPWITKVKEEDDLRLAQMEDIAAMKLSAISGRGTKKDFIDLYYLLRHFNLREIMQYYNRKYHDGSEFLVLKSLTYFEDADPDQSPVMLQPIDWDKIKEAIIKQVENYS